MAFERVKSQLEVGLGMRGGGWSIPNLFLAAWGWVLLVWLLAHYGWGWAGRYGTQ